MRLPIFLFMWFILTEGSSSGLPVAVGATVLAAAASLALQPRRTWRWTAGGFVRFVPFFLAQSAAGGVDVARRALHPRLPIDPGMVAYHTRLPDGPARRFFAGVTGLLPGTLTARVEGDRLIVHVLDRRSAFAGTLRRLEDLTASLFGVTLER